MANVNVTRNPPNSEIYSHIPIAEIVKLHNLGYSHRKIGKLRGMGPAAVGNRLRKEGILGTFPKVTEAQLKEALNDPAWQARQGVIDPAVPTNRVVCLECRELKCELNANGNHSHLAGKHHMPAAEYKRNHPGARLVSFKRSAAQNTRQGRTKTIQDLMAEDAEAYVTPEIWKAVARDEEWEEHKGIMKFVVCRMRSPQGYRCGFKSKSDLHLHLKAWHGLTSAAYRELFPKALQLPLGAYPAKNKIAKTYADRRRKEISELKASDKRVSEQAAKTEQLQLELTQAEQRVLELRGQLEAAREAQTLPPDPHVTLAACLALRGIKPYEMRDELFPRVFRPAASEQRQARYSRVKQLFRRDGEEIEREKIRLAKLSESDRETAAEAARQEFQKPNK